MFNFIPARPRFLLTALFFLSAYAANSQSIIGKVTDKNGKDLSFVEIQVMDLADSTIKGETLSDTLGQYRFDSLKLGNYMVIFRHPEYESKRFRQDILSSGPVSLNVQLTEQVVMLMGSGIVAKKDAVKQKNDTMEYNAGSYKVNKDASAENLVTKMPGITNENGTIKAQGEEVKKVTVDGQDFFGDDAVAALKNLPAEVVDKIQVFDRQSDQSQFTGFDDGNSQKTLNIVTKSGKNNGQFGKVYGGYGTNDRWAAGGNINVFKGKQRFSFIGLSNNINQQNFSSQDILGLTGSTGGGQGGPPGGMGRGPQGGGGGNRQFGGGGSNSNFLVGQQNGINTTNSFGFNYSAFGGKKLKLTASYFYNNSINNTASFLNRTYFLSGGGNQLYSQGDTAKARNYNHRVNARLEYMLDSSNSIIFTPSASFQKNISNSTFLGLTNTQELQSLNRSFSTTRSERNGYNLNGSLLFRHKFRKPGHTLSLNINTSYNESDGNTLLVSNNAYYQPSFFSDDFRQNTDNKSNSYSVSPSLSYTMALNKRSFLEANYSPSINKSKSYKYTTRYDSSSNEYSVVDSLLSNTFDNTSITQRIGLTYRYKFEKLSFNIGANAQQTILKGEQSFPADRSLSKTFNNILPNAMLIYQFSKTRNLRMNYRSNTNLPSISQLQNVVNNSNPLILSTGNPDLKQEFSNNIFARYSSTNAAKGRNFFIFGSVSMTQDYIGNNNILATSDTVINDIELRKGAQINMPVNLDGNRSFRSFATYGFPIKKVKSVLNMNLGQSLLRSPALINGRTNYSNTSNSNAGLVLASNISEKIDFTLNYTANYNVVTNTIQSSSNNSYLIHYFNGKINWLPTKHIVLNTDISNSTYRGLGAAFNQSIWLWNAGVGYKFMKDQRAEIKLSVFDLLKQNRSIARTVTENYIEDKTTQILTRFYMLTFTYNVRNFKMK